MAKSITKLSESEKKFLLTILEHGNLTDTEISKKTGLSKSTCSRIRTNLEDDFISEYIPIIDLDKVGIDVFLVLTFQWNAFDNDAVTKETFSKLRKDPNVIFLANGEGSIATTVLFVGFQNLEGCNAYLKDFRKTHGKYAQQINTIILPSKEVMKNDFTEIIKSVIGGK